MNLGAWKSAMDLQPLLMIQVKPVDEQKELELAAALTELSEEDPLLHYERNPMTEQMYLRVMGKVQIEILEELLQTRFGLEITCSNPSVVYKEMPGHMAVGKEVYTMPKPCWAVVELQIEPLPPGSGIVFSSAIKEKVLPYRYQNHVKTSVEDTFRQGIYGWEVTDAKVTLTDGEHHPEGEWIPLTGQSGFFRAGAPIERKNRLTDSLWRKGTGCSFRRAIANFLFCEIAVGEEEPRGVTAFVVQMECDEIGAA